MVDGKKVLFQRKLIFIILNSLDILPTYIIKIFTLQYAVFTKARKPTWAFFDKYRKSNIRFLDRKGGLARIKEKLSLNLIIKTL